MLPELEWLTHVADGPVGTFIVGVLILVFGTPAILSETAAKKFGGLGKLARAFRSSKARAIADDKQLQADLVDSLKARIDELCDRIDEVKDECESDVKELRSHIALLETGLRVRDEYILWVTAWVHDLRVFMANMGVKMPPPPFKTFPEFRKEHERQHG